MPLNEHFLEDDGVFPAPEGLAGVGKLVFLFGEFAFRADRRYWGDLVFEIVDFGFQLCGFVSQIVKFSRKWELWRIRILWGLCARGLEFVAKSEPAAKGADFGN
jgi:hypothetical protein